MLINGTRVKSEDVEVDINAGDVLNELIRRYIEIGCDLDGVTHSQVIAAFDIVNMVAFELD